ncbi:MAG: hypothetical protein HO274_11835 [Ferrovum myxofaciens]|uniref:hypothetical protein n=1 Tax=Ferrovum myxofaciens TaxID=416213 RepID=UPI00235421CA|nr:hypothetical protein [Ferrovum myxofaciens]QKE41922.1 MAG: hypothetical protein HO274_11835 [Ferrovum myxofaciens]
MKPVTQEEISGCGIASVATLAGISYQEAKTVANSLGIFAESSLWSDTRHVRVLLGYFGILAGEGELPFSSWEKLPDLALLSIKWHLEGGRPFWHWVVFWRSPNGTVVFDPKKSLKINSRTDFWRIKPKWFIPIEAARYYSPTNPTIKPA